MVIWVIIPLGLFSWLGKGFASPGLHQTCVHVWLLFMAVAIGGTILAAIRRNI